jgi:hypothetical protein
MSLPNWKKNEIEPLCQKCHSDDVSRTNPSIVTLIYFVTLYWFKHVNFHCFQCGNDWNDYYFKIKTRTKSEDAK